MESTSDTSVGVGGWAYFPSKGENRLSLCARIYDFVEVNSSFYKLPQESLARKWRSIVPENFQFTLRANRKLTHESHLEPIEENFREYEKNLNICHVLRASILHFQFPPSFEVTTAVVKKWRDFFGSVKREKGLHLAVELRNSSGDKRGIQSFEDDHDIIPVSDPYRSEIQVSKGSKIQYSRIFGLGEHTKWSFSTGELEELRQKMTKTPATRRYVTFHNITMYEDGARMRNMLAQGGKDLDTSFVGIDALKQAIIAERIHFPILCADLSQKLAWRTIGIPNGRQEHVNNILTNIGTDVRFEYLEDALRKCSPLFSPPSVGQRI